MRAHYFCIIVVVLTLFCFIPLCLAYAALIPRLTNAVYRRVPHSRALAAHAATIFEARSLQVCNNKMRKSTKTIWEAYISSKIGGNIGALVRDHIKNTINAGTSSHYDCCLSTLLCVLLLLCCCMPHTCKYIYKTHVLLKPKFKKSKVALLWQTTLQQRQKEVQFSAKTKNASLKLKTEKEKKRNVQYAKYDMSVHWNNNQKNYVFIYGSFVRFLMALFRYWACGAGALLALKRLRSRGYMLHTGKFILLATRKVVGLLKPENIMLLMFETFIYSISIKICLENARFFLFFIQSQ